MLDEPAPGVQHDRDQELPPRAGALAVWVAVERLFHVIGVTEGGVHQLRTEKGLDQAVLEPDAAGQRLDQAEPGAPGRSQPLIDHAERTACHVVYRLQALADLVVDWPLNHRVQADFKAVVLQADAGEG